MQYLSELTSVQLPPGERSHKNSLCRCAGHCFVVTQRHAYVVTPPCSVSEIPLPLGRAPEILCFGALRVFSSRDHSHHQSHQHHHHHHHLHPHHHLEPPPSSASEHVCLAVAASTSSSSTATTTSPTTTTTSSNVTASTTNATTATTTTTSSSNSNNNTSNTATSSSSSAAPATSSTAVPPSSSNNPNPTSAAAGAAAASASAAAASSSSSSSASASSSVGASSESLRFLLYVCSTDAQDPTRLSGQAQTLQLLFPPCHMLCDTLRYFLQTSNALVQVFVLFGTDRLAHTFVLQPRNLKVVEVDTFDLAPWLCYLPSPVLSSDVATLALPGAEGHLKVYALGCQNGHVRVAVVNQSTGEWQTDWLSWEGPISTVRVLLPTRKGAQAESSGGQGFSRYSSGVRMGVSAVESRRRGAGGGVGSTASTSSGNAPPPSAAGGSKLHPSLYALAVDLSDEEALSEGGASHSSHESSHSGTHGGGGSGSRATNSSPLPTPSYPGSAFADMTELLESVRLLVGTALGTWRVHMLRDKTFREHGRKDEGAEEEEEERHEAGVAKEEGKGGGEEEKEEEEEGEDETEETRARLLTTADGDFLRVNLHRTAGLLGPVESCSREQITERVLKEHRSMEDRLEAEMSRHMDSVLCGFPLGMDFSSVLGYGPEENDGASSSRAASVPGATSAAAAASSSPSSLLPLSSIPSLSYARQGDLCAAVGTYTGAVHLLGRWLEPSNLVEQVPVRYGPVQGIGSLQLPHPVFGVCELGSPPVPSPAAPASKQLEALNQPPLGTVAVLTLRSLHFFQWDQDFLERLFWERVKSLLDLGITEELPAAVSEVLFRGEAAGAGGGALR